MREEYGCYRTSCVCGVCVTNCKFMPGFLIPADLERMIPKGEDPWRWAEKNLRASPGALAMKDGEVFRISTLVPAQKPEGGCINLSPLGLCQIHEAAPFGCAFFDCGPESPDILHEAMTEICLAWAQPPNLYWSLWIHLAYLGLEAEAPEVLRKRMQANAADI